MSFFSTLKDWATKHGSACHSQAVGCRTNRRRSLRYESLESRQMFAAGDLDTTFSSDGFNRYINAGNSAEGTAAAVQPDGKVVIVGTDELDSGDKVIYVVRITTSGSFDDTFDGNGIKIIDFGSTRDDVGTDVRILSNGDILVAGSSSGSSGDDFALARLNSDGSFDTGFSGDGKVLINFGGDDNGRKIQVQSDGKIVMVGTTFLSGGGDVAIARLNSNGSLDTTFSGDGRKVVDTSGQGNLDSVAAFAISSNGKYIVGATTFPGTSGGDWQIGWFHASGNLYRTKRIAMGGNDFLRDLVMTSSGQITIVGSATIGSETFPAAARLTSTGVYDSSFDGPNGNGNGRFRIESFASDNVTARSVLLTTGGKILIGASAEVFGDFDFAIARLNANGSFDTTFSGDGFATYTFPASPSGSGLPDDFLSDMVISGSKLIAVGKSTIASGEDRMAAMRVLLT